MAVLEAGTAGTSGSRRRAGAVVALLAVALAVWTALRDPVWHFSGWCLSHARGAVERMPYDPGRGYPLFRLPWSDPRASMNLPPGETGLGVVYTRPHYRVSRGGALERARADFAAGRGAWARCPRTALPNGLARFEASDLPGCTWRASDIAWRSTQYKGAALVEGLGPVNLSCGNDPAVVGCRMWFLMPGDWQAEVTLPKTMLDEWQDVAAAAAALFARHFRDCTHGG